MTIAESDRPAPGWFPLATLLAMPILVATLTVSALLPLRLSPSIATFLVLAAQDGSALLYYSALAGARAWPSLRERFPSVSRRTAMIALAVAVGVKTLFVGLGALADGLGADLVEPAADPLVASNLAELALTLPAAVLLAPLWEELFFRGLLLDRLRRHMPVPAVVLLSSLLFALVHDNQLKLGMTGVLFFSERFAMGVAAALLALRYRSLTPAFLFHGAFNAIAEVGAVLIPS